MSKDQKHSAQISSDPLVDKAARDALNSVPENPKREHPWRYRFIITFGVLAILLGMVGAILGTINSLGQSHSNQELKDAQTEIKKEQACIVALVTTITTEQEARLKISGDDREILKDFIRSIAHAKSSQDVKDALETFLKQSKINDKRRARFPVPKINKDVCAIQNYKAIHSPTSPVSSPTPTPPPVPVGSTTKPNASDPGPKTVVRTTVIHTPGAQPSTVTSTHIVARPQPTKTVTKTAPAPSPKPSPKPTHKPTPKPSPKPTPLISIPPVCIPALGCISIT